MKIEKFELDTAYQGLHPVVMDRLGEVVLLAGRNGSGKSRLLRAVAEMLNSHISAEEMEAIEREKRQHGEQCKNLEQHILNLGHQPPSASREDQKTNAVKQIENRRIALQALEARLQRHRLVTLDTEGIKATPVLYQVKETDLVDHAALRLSEIESASSNIASEFSVSLARNYGLPALKDFVNRYVYADGDERLKLEPDMLRLKQLLKDFLHADLSWDSRSPKLFDMPIGQAQLSEGQKVLLQIALSIFFQDGTRQGLVLLLDEPENHLHPRAVLDVVARIRAACPAAQVWIATHSIHVLAQYYDSSGIWFIEGGAVEFAGSNASRVLDSLIGGEDSAEALADFLALPARLAVAQFAAQCLLSPAVVDTGSSDPQTTHIAEILLARKAEDRPLRVLDFGIGKGRLLTALMHHCNQEGLRLSDVFDFRGFDIYPSEEDESLCKSRILEAYGSHVGRYLRGPHSLEELDDDSVDIIVMCNVLHEVPPANWLDLFGAHGTLTRVAAESGVLLVVEDQVLRVGERAHNFGFLVLDGLELRLLFGENRESSAIRTFEHPEARYRGRLKAHQISSAVLSNASAETRKACVAQLVRSADARLTEIQEAPFSSRAARSYAFWAHQHVNASRALGGL